MVAAMSAVHDQSLTVTQAARKYNVPRKTLNDRIKKKVVHGNHPGPSTMLTSKEDALCPILCTWHNMDFHSLAHSLKPWPGP